MKTVHRMWKSARPVRAWTCLFLSVFVAACAGEAGEASEDGLGAPVLPDGTVELDPSAALSVGLTVVEVVPMGEVTLAATGTVLYDQNRVSRVGPRIEGRVVRIAGDLGDQVAAGAPLVVIESAELGEVEAEHARALAELELAQESFDREQGLFEKGISSRKEVLEAQAELERARAALAAASARHRTLDPADSVSADGYYSLSAPIAGTVVERNVMLGQIVGPDDDLFTVADLRTLWLVLDIYDRDLARVRDGLPVEVEAAAFPGTSFRGTLTHVGQVVDSLTRTVKARVVVANPGNRLRPGMFVTALVRGVDAGAAVAVPQASVHRIEDRTVVFVPLGQGRYALRDVVTSGSVGDALVTVVRGLAPGDSVVSEGSFYLKSELLKQSFGGDES